LDEPEYGLHLFGIITAATEWSMAWWHRALGEPLGAADVEPLTWWLAEQSRRRTPADYLSTIEWLQRWSRRVAAWWGDGFDLLITPTMADVPPPLGFFTFDPENPVSVLLRVTELTPLLMCWNVTGSPAISLPLATAEDLPVGVQLVAPPGADSRVLAVAAQLEEALPWKDRRPPTL
jgi:amidase